MRTAEKTVEVSNDIFGPNLESSRPYIYISSNTVNGTPAIATDIVIKVF